MFIQFSEFYSLLKDEITVGNNPTINPSKKAKRMRRALPPAFAV
jgi:hypothetical protein